jgi:hypothetical protein
MADPATCIAFVLQNEDRPLLHAIVPDLPGAWGMVAGVKTWLGAHAVSGINSTAFPLQYAAIAAIPQAARGPAVENFYQTEEWSTWYAELPDDNQAAMRILDMAVNSGEGHAWRTAQAAVNAISPAQIAEDGHPGPATVTAINVCNQNAFVAAFRAAHVEHLEEFDADNPALPQLIARAQE